MKPKRTRWLRSTRHRRPKRPSRRRQSRSRPQARMRWATSAPSKRSRSMMKALDQIISSGGQSRTGTPSTVAGTRVREPEVVDDGHAVARAEDEIDEAISRIRLAQPVRERELGREAGLSEHGERRLAVLLPEEDVQVLRVPDDAGVRRECVSAADEELHAAPAERLQRVDGTRAGSRGRARRRAAGAHPTVPREDLPRSQRDSRCTGAPVSSLETRLPTARRGRRWRRGAARA